MKSLFLATGTFVFAFFFMGCASASVADETSAFSGPEPAVAIKEAESFYKNRDKIEECRKAVETLDKARNPETRNFDVEWKFAQYSYYLGAKMEQDEQIADKVLSKGMSAANIARRMEPDKPEGHFWYAAILGEQSKRNRITVGVASIPKIREAMERVIKIDPGYQGASAYDGLGQLEMGTRGMAGGSIEKAVEYFEKAIEVDGNNSYTLLHLAEAKLAQQKDAEAKKLLDKILSMPVDPNFIPEHNETTRDAKKLLETKF